MVKLEGLSHFSNVDSISMKSGSSGLKFSEKDIKRQIFSCDSNKLKVHLLL